jgi:hypothetical protein
MPGEASRGCVRLRGSSLSFRGLASYPRNLREAGRLNFSHRCSRFRDRKRAAGNKKSQFFRDARSPYRIKAGFLEQVSQDMLSKSDEFWDRFHSLTVTNINENLNIITLTRA